MLPNPYATQSAFTVNQPASLPALPFERPRSEAGKEAVRLHKAAQSATARLQEARDAAHQAAVTLTQTRDALAVEIQRGAVEGIDPDKEHALSLELAAAERLADPQTHALRSRAAVQAQRAAVQAYCIHAWGELPELLAAELADEAHAASEALTKALESIAPVRERWLAIARQVHDLVSMAAVGEWAAEWAAELALAEEPLPPLPSAEGLATFERARQPEPVAVEPVADLEAVEAVDLEPDAELVEVD